MGNNWTTQLGDHLIYGLEQNGAYFCSSNYAFYNNPTINGLNFRKGVRDGFYVRDIELVVNGFSMDENIGWTNVYKIS